MQPPVPQFDGTKPYQQITFQYSLHYIEQPGGELKHMAFLAQSNGKDPRRELAEALCRDIPLNVCTLAYNDPFEKGRIRELAAIYPDLYNHLMNIHDHIQDLLVPFKCGCYYVPVDEEMPVGRISAAAPIRPVSSSQAKSTFSI